MGLKVFPVSSFFQGGRLGQVRNVPNIALLFLVPVLLHKPGLKDVLSYLWTPTQFLDPEKSSQHVASFR